MIAWLHLRRHRHSDPLPDSYLTDGSALFRVTSVLRGAGRVMLVSLEDCRTLETRVHAFDELDALSLRRVSNTHPPEAVHHADRSEDAMSLPPLAGQHTPWGLTSGLGLWRSFGSGWHNPERPISTEG